MKNKVEISEEPEVVSTEDHLKNSMDNQNYRRDVEGNVLGFKKLGAKQKKEKDWVLFNTIGNGKGKQRGKNFYLENTSPLL